MNTDIITNSEYEINNNINHLVISNDDESIVSDEILGDENSNMLEVVSRNFNGKQLIID
jgi:stress-induced morphogen